MLGSIGRIISQWEHSLWWTLRGECRGNMEGKLRTTTIMLMGSTYEPLITPAEAFRKSICTGLSLERKRKRHLYVDKNLHAYANTYADTCMHINPGTSIFLSPCTVQHSRGARSVTHRPIHLTHGCKKTLYVFQF